MSESTDDLAPTSSAKPISHWRLLAGFLLILIAVAIAWSYLFPWLFRLLLIFSALIVFYTGVRMLVRSHDVIEVDSEGNERKIS